MAQLDFNVNEVKINEYDVIPAGWYTACIVESVIQESKTGDQYLKLQYQIIDGKYNGRRVFDNLYLWYPNQTAVQIAQKSIASIAKSVGMIGENVLTDTNDLLDKILDIKLSIKAAEGDYDESNIVRGYAENGTKFDASLELSSEKLDNTVDKLSQMSDNVVAKVPF